MDIWEMVSSTNYREVCTLPTFIVGKRGSKRFRIRGGFFIHCEVKLIVAWKLWNREIYVTYGWDIVLEPRGFRSEETEYEILVCIVWIIKKKEKKKCQMNAKIGVNFATSPYDFLSILTFKMLNILHHLGEEYTNVYIFQAEEFWNSQVCFILFFFLFSFSFCV